MQAANNWKLGIGYVGTLSRIYSGFINLSVFEVFFKYLNMFGLPLALF